MEPIWNCPIGIPELRRSQLKELSASDLLDRHLLLRRQLEDTMSELTDRWLIKETGTVREIEDE